LYRSKLLSELRSQTTSLVRKWQNEWVEGTALTRDVEVGHVSLEILFGLLGATSEEFAEIVEATRNEALGSLLCPLGSIDDSGVVEVVVAKRVFV
jgi:hypothetical protein